jgi:hypothetical protein
VNYRLVAAWLLVALMYAFLVVACSTMMLARDHGQFANSTPEMRDWFNSLASGKGPCCSDADGTALSDVDWQTHDGHYQVRIGGQWIDVPDDAVLHGPNKAGRTMVWPMYVDGHPTIRCFIPGEMT